MPAWLAAAAAITAGLYLLLVLGLLVAGRRTDARAVAGFIPDCIVLFKRLLSDPRLSRRRKLLIAVLVAYLVLPFDLVPDFIPIAGQLDDAILVWLAVRGLWRTGLIQEHWPGPDLSRI